MIATASLHASSFLYQDFDDDFKSFVNEICSREFFENFCLLSLDCPELLGEK